MSCQRFKRALSGYLDERISGAEKVRVEDHLTRCRECAALWTELSEMRLHLKSLPGAPVPARLQTNLQVIASRQLARARANRTLPAALRNLGANLSLALDNMMRPLALPLAGGLLSALLLFSALVPVLGFRPATGTDVPTVLYTPVSLVEVTQFGASDDGTVVELFVDSKGKAMNYSVQRGQLNPEMQADLSRMMFYSRFAPATRFGQPTNGKVLISFRRVQYLVRG
jgi:Putative zinc-finger